MKSGQKFLKSPNDIVLMMNLVLPTEITKDFEDLTTLTFETLFEPYNWHRLLQEKSKRPEEPISVKPP